MIPPEKSAAVTRGLRAAFGVTEWEDIHMIKDLASSMVFRIVVRGDRFLLKISTRTNDPARHYSCMKAAAEAGLAPHVWYSSNEDRVSLTDFVETRPFPATDALVRMPATLRKLHGLPPFAGVPNHINTTYMFLMHKGPAVDGFLEKVRAARLLPGDQTEELLARYAEVAAVYPHHEPDMVSSHNDLFKPDNILFDGQRVWLVDWEAAFRNDRYADLAVVANLVAGNEEEEQIFLQEYFGSSPDEYQRARFFLAQQAAHMFYALVYLMMGSAAQPIDWNETVPEFREFHRSFWAGAVDLTDNRTKTVYGRVHWERLARNMRHARFQEALRIVADRRAS